MVKSIEDKIHILVSRLPVNSPIRRLMLQLGDNKPVTDAFLQELQELHYFGNYMILLIQTFSSNIQTFLWGNQPLPLPLLRGGLPAPYDF